MTPTNRPRRSCLFMPGSNPRALAKARGLAADMIAIDLEDAVAPSAKAEARALVVAELAEGGFGARDLLVRVNGLETTWCEDDLGAVIKGGARGALNGVIFPKVASAGDIRTIEAALSAAGAPPELALWVMIETPLAILNLGEIAASGADTRLAGLIAGTNDLVKEMRARLSDARLAVLPPLSQMVMAARAYGLAVLDGVYNDFRDEAGLIAEAEQGLSLGFDGKTLIHPAQIEAANRAFSPTAEELAEARAIVTAFADPANAGLGAVAVGGRMAELLHLEEAQRVLALQAMIEKGNA